MSPATPFDDLAGDYDRSFIASVIGERLRAAVWRRLDITFQPGERVLELNCGTGEDAVHLAQRGVHVLATDSSTRMVEMARAKVGCARRAGSVEVAQLAIEDLPAPEFGMFDGVLSNFGGLNCVERLADVAQGLATMLRPGARALLCVMGPVVPWEWGWFLAHGEPRKAFRRLNPRGAHWRGLTIRYPSIRAVRQVFAPHFTQRRVSAIGALVPPTYTEAWAARHPRLLEALDHWERRFESVPPLPWMADHYLVELERVRDQA